LPLARQDRGTQGVSLSCADILTVLYFHEMNVSPENPTMKDSGCLYCPKDTVPPALYAVLAEKGYYPKEDI
jgi:transketolase